MQDEHAPGGRRRNKIVVSNVVWEIDLDNLPHDPQGWARLLADAEGDLLARQAHHAHLSAAALNEFAEASKKQLPEHRLKLKLRADPEHYRREVEIAEAHRSVVFLRAIVQLIIGGEQIWKS